MTSMKELAEALDKIVDDATFTEEMRQGVWALISDIKDIVELRDSKLIIESWRRRTYFVKNYFIAMIEQESIDALANTPATEPAAAPAADTQGV